MNFEGAVIREQGQTFAIVVVKPYVLNTNSSANQAQVSFSPAFPGMPIILMAQDGRGVPRYYGRRDIVNFLASISMNRIPWRRYSFA